ncbi:MAG TPA: hypothetical protein VKP30_15550 [Polyangiaceae bacterium]|nr:hypothetical protein [Polyangiaceae bacterium]
MNQLSPEARRLFQLAREGDEAPVHVLQRAESRLAARISRGAVIAAVSTVVTKAAATATATLPWIKIATSVSIAVAASGVGWWGARAANEHAVVSAPNNSNTVAFNANPTKQRAVVSVSDDRNAAVQSDDSMRVERAVSDNSSVERAVSDNSSVAAPKIPLPALAPAVDGAELTKVHASAPPTLGARKASVPPASSRWVPDRESRVSPIVSVPGKAGAFVPSPNRASGSGASNEDSPQVPTDYRLNVESHAPALSNEDPLNVEVRALRQAQQALRAGQGVRVLALLREQERAHASGALHEERAAAKVLALCQVGQTHVARREAERFERSWPKSSLLARLRNYCWKP